jgi:hypothetical protein
LADVFGKLMNTGYVRVRLDVVETNACRRFHRDKVPARLICTYRGQGTQFGLGVPGGVPDPVIMAPAWSPLLLRGDLWQADPSPGVVHRSPPIEGTGEARLVLVLDPVASPCSALSRG